ncbi:hypothetical protein BOX15_Mlig004372g5, partial [Macrostomum lignano]
YFRLLKNLLAAASKSRQRLNAFSGPSQLRVLSSSATKENQAQVIRCHSDKKREDKSRSNGGTFAAVTASVAMATVAVNRDKNNEEKDKPENESIENSF